MSRADYYAKQEQKKKDEWNAKKNPQTNPVYTPDPTDKNPAPKNTGTTVVVNNGGGGIKKRNDKPKVKALEKMLRESFKKNRDIKLDNISTRRDYMADELLLGYEERAGHLDDARTDNEKAEAAVSYSNIANLARERVDSLAQAAVQGAGESDTLKAAMTALRNWDANQSQTNRAYFDTARSIDGSITELNADTRSGLVTIWDNALTDIGAVWDDYYRQRADAYNQIGNIKGDPYSDAYHKDSKMYDKMADEVGRGWENPGIPDEIANWEGSVQTEEAWLNNSYQQAAKTNQAPKAPEGATLRKW